MKEKALFFPFEAKDIAIVLSLEKFCSSYKIETVCTYMGTGLAGKDIGYSDNRHAIGIIVESNFAVCIEKADVLIVPPIINEQIHQMVVQSIIMALKKQKK